MWKKVANLQVNKNKDYYRKTVKALEDAGFMLIIETETFSDIFYVIASKEDNES